MAVVPTKSAQHQSFKEKAFFDLESTRQLVRVAGYPEVIGQRLFNSTVNYVSLKKELRSWYTVERIGEQKLLFRMPALQI